MDSLPIILPHPPGKSYRLLTLARRLAMVVLVVFLLPTAATAAWWSLKDRPQTWRAADWGTSGVLPAATTDDAAIYIMAARTGGMKGAVSVHSWIVVKKPGASTYERYDKVGWGSPIRRNGYLADAFWYSNRPWVVRAVVGEEALGLIPAVEEAIETYPYSAHDGYRIWPGPNSNSFVAHVLETVPALGIRLPPHAVGRDFRPGHVALRIAPDWRDAHVTLSGFAGFALGVRSGVEIHFLGLVAGIDITRPALKIPALGRIGF